MLVLNREKCVFKINSAFADLVEFELNKAQLNLKLPLETAFAGGAILVFRDPDYNYENGGYHPVEVCINHAGVLQYVTDFSHVGKPPFVELAKELDFSFENRCFGHMGVDYPISEGEELFAVFQANFISYYQSEVFTVEVSD